MIDAPSDPSRFSPDDNLPRVEPPTPGFILQLFVIPAIVVLVIVLVWLLFNWLAHMGGNTASYIAEMKENKANSWQQAYNLAEALRRSEEDRRNPALAKDLADYLDVLLKQPLPEVTEENRHKRNPRKEEIERRGFLCMALGEFRVADHALPALLRAAVPHRDEDTLRLRLAALQAIALLADNVRAEKPLSDPKLLPTLILASEDETPVIAEAGTFALGVVGGDEAARRLVAIIAEPHPAEVHYNAATGLARQGNEAAIPLLVEMIDPTSTRGLDREEPKNRDAKRARLQLNGLRGARELVAKDPTADFTPIEAVLEKLSKADAPSVIHSEAAALKRDMAQRRTSPAP